MECHLDRLFAFGLTMSSYTSRVTGPSEKNASNSFIWIEGSYHSILYLQSRPAECCLLPPLSSDVMSVNKRLFHIILSLRKFRPTSPSFEGGVTAKLVADTFVLGCSVLLTVGVCSLGQSNDLWLSRLHRNPKLSECLSVAFTDGILHAESIEKYKHFRNIHVAATDVQTHQERLAHP